MPKTLTASSMRPRHLVDALAPHINVGGGSSDSGYSNDATIWSQYDPDRAYMQNLMAREMYGPQGRTGWQAGSPDSTYYIYGPGAPGHSGGPGSPPPNLGGPGDTGGDSGGGDNNRGRFLYNRTATTTPAGYTAPNTTTPPNTTTNNTTPPPPTRVVGPRGSGDGSGGPQQMSRTAQTSTAQTTGGFSGLSNVSPEAQALMRSQGVEPRGQGNYAAGPGGRTFQGGTHTSSGFDPNPDANHGQSGYEAWMRGIEADQSNRSNSPFDVGGAHTGGLSGTEMSGSTPGVASAQGAQAQRGAMAQQGFTQDGAGRWRNQATGEVVDASGNSIAGTSSYAGGGSNMPSGFGVTQADYQAALNSAAAGGPTSNTSNRSTQNRTTQTSSAQDSPVYTSAMPGYGIRQSQLTNTAEPDPDNLIPRETPIPPTNMVPPPRVVPPREVPPNQPPGSGGPPGPVPVPPAVEPGSPDMPWTPYSVTEPGPPTEFDPATGLPVKPAPASNAWNQGGASGNRQLAGGQAFGAYSDMVNRGGYDAATQSAIQQNGFGATRAAFAGLGDRLGRNVAATGNNAGYAAAMSQMGRDQAGALGNQGRQNTIDFAKEKIRQKEQGAQGLSSLNTNEGNYMLGLTGQRAALSSTPLSKVNKGSGTGQASSLNFGFSI